MKEHCENAPPGPTPGGDAEPLSWNPKVDQVMQLPYVWTCSQKTHLADVDVESIGGRQRVVDICLSDQIENLVMEVCSEEHGDDVYWVDVTLGAEMVDLMFSKLRVSASDVESILGAIDETCLENHGDNLNIDPIAEKYRQIEWVYFIWPWGAVILSTSSQ